MIQNKLIAFNVFNITEWETLNAGRALVVQLKTLNIKNTTAVSDFVDKARKEAGWPVAAKILKKAIENPENGKVEAMIAEWVGPEIKLPEMIVVPAGKFMMGSEDFEYAKPVRRVEITKAFELGRYPVTNEEYRAFCEATGKVMSEHVTDLAEARHPVILVSWDDAVAYCKWAGGRLPTEAEWEYAARGTEGRNYPYGEDFEYRKCNFGNKTGIAPVDAHPGGAGPFGHEDMSGNAWEWTGDRYADKYDSEELIDPQGPKEGRSRVIRGGAWNSNINYGTLRNANRAGKDSLDRGFAVGFRFARDLK